MCLLGLKHNFVCELFSVSSASQENTITGLPQNYTSENVGVSKKQRVNTTKNFLTSSHTN